MRNGKRSPESVGVASQVGRHSTAVTAGLFLQPIDKCRRVLVKPAPQFLDCDQHADKSGQTLTETFSDDQPSLNRNYGSARKPPLRFFATARQVGKAESADGAALMFEV
jgi:hypothetical protein